MLFEAYVDTNAASVPGIAEEKGGQQASKVGKESNLKLGSSRLQAQPQTDSPAATNAI